MSLVSDIVDRFKAQLAGQFTSSIIGGLIIVGLARLLDPDGYGLLFLTLTIIGTFQLVARLGIARSAGRYVAEYRETEPEQVPYIVRSSLLVTLAMILVTVLALVISYRYIATLLDEPELNPFLLLGALLLGTGTFLIYLTKLLQGFEAIRFLAGMKIVREVSRLVLALGLVVAGFGAMGALAGYLISSIVGCLIGSVYLYRRVTRIHDPESTVEPGLRRRMLEYAVPITMTNTAQILDKRIDTLLIGYFLAPVEVGFYVIGDRAVRFIETPISALGFTLSPTFGSQKAAGNIGAMSRVYETALVNTLLLYIPVGAGVILVADPFIRLVFGQEYLGAVAVLQVLGLYLVFRAVAKITDNGLDYLGRARERAIVRAITAALNVALNVALIPIVGVVGAAISTVITYGIYTAANLYIVNQEFELRVGYLAEKVGVIAAITGVMSVVVFVLEGALSGWLSLVFVVGVGTLIWAVLSLATGLLELRKLLSVFS